MVSVIKKKKGGGKGGRGRVSPCFLLSPSPQWEEQENYKEVSTLPYHNHFPYHALSEKYWKLLQIYQPTCSSQELKMILLVIMLIVNIYL